MQRGKTVPDETVWKTISTQKHYADDHLAVVTETVETPGRSKPKPWTTVRRKAAVVIAPMTRDGKFLLVRQVRISIRTVIWEMPAGQIDATGDPAASEIEATALRELTEETGYKLAARGQLIPLGHFFTSPGFTDERNYFFLARPVEPNDSDDEAEDLILDCRAFTAKELQRMIATGEIRDANTLSIYARLSARGLLPSDSK